MNRRRGTSRLKGFTLIEMLVVLSVISLLTAILLPALSTAKSQARDVLCKNNVKQLAFANQSYANENSSYSVPGAVDVFAGNLHRWYGVRTNQNEPFDPAAGPLASYLASVRMECPQKNNYLLLQPHQQDYESGNGGYGYNLSYLGSLLWQKGYEDSSYKESTKLTHVRRPAETLAFADTAMHKRFQEEAVLLPYAFAEPRYLIINQQPDPTWNPYPSIHFRHRRQANIGWADGHADSKKTGAYKGRNEDGTYSADEHIGWFEPMDNSLFDLK